jgi:hypothetical protein
MIAWFLLVEECVIHHVVCPVESREVMKEACDQIGSRNRTDIMSKGLGNPGQHDSDVHAAEVTEFG